MAKTTIMLIRHGETPTNVKKVVHKHGDEAVLTTLGEKQIKLTAETLSKAGIEKIYTSSEARAIASAEIISDICSIVLEIHTSLGERNWGKFHSKPWKDILKVLEPMSMKDRYTYVPPGGESWQSFEYRLVEALKGIMKKDAGKTIGVVTHGGSIRALIPFLFNKSKEESFKYEFDNASISTFDFVGDCIKPIDINSTAHLKNLSEL